MAVSNNNFNLVKELINYHNYGQIGQHTEVVSLCLAVKRCYFNIVEYLIDYGCINPNDCVQLSCKHCKTDSDEIQRYQFPLYRNELFLKKKIFFFLYFNRCLPRKSYKSCEIFN